MNNFIPVYKYAELHKTTKQNVYRWIREGKFKKGDLKLEEIITKRLRINTNAKPLIK